MKAICIVGSPNSNGSTSYVSDKIIEGLKVNNIETKKYVLGEMNINYCKGCNSCHETRKCIQTDDMDKIFADLYDSDIVIIASPSYWGDVTGQLKVFFDRSTPLCDTNGETLVPKGKLGISVSIRAGSHVEENIHLINAIEHYYGHLGIKPIKRFTIEGVNTKNDLIKKQDKLNEAFELGKNIIFFDQK